MRLFFREKGRKDQKERLFQSFTLCLMARGFDLIVFDKNQIKKHLGRGLYREWKNSLRVLRYRKIIAIFSEKESKISRPSDGYPDRLVVNMSRYPDIEAIRRAEEELFRSIKS